MKKLLIFMILVTAISYLNTSILHANSAEPPSIIIIVLNAPNDLEISMGSTKARRIDKGVESHYIFYYNEIKSADNTLKVTTIDRNFEITLDTPLQKYNNIYTLHLESRTLTPGKSLSISLTLVSLRVILTLIIEAIVFFLFVYRSKRSWLVFLIVNLITQGILSIFLDANSNSSGGYVIFPLIGAEIVVLVVELYAFTIFINEHGRLRTALFVITANLLSLIAGGYLITILPV
jgi:hypothetical protein